MNQDVELVSSAARGAYSTGTTALAVQMMSLWSLPQPVSLHLMKLIKGNEGHELVHGSVAIVTRQGIQRDIVQHGSPIVVKKKDEFVSFYPFSFG